MYLLVNLLIKLSMLHNA